MDENISCFACGAANPAGLGLRFTYGEDGATAEFSPSVWHQGYDGITHGGIIATLLDEAMAQALLARGMAAVTARLEVRFKEPLATGTTASVRGWFAGSAGRAIKAEAVAAVGNIIIADAKGIFVPRDAKLNP